jgi:hypothetical protein
MLDVFKSDAFSVVSLTDAIIKAPYKPGRIGALGLFREKGITTKTAVVEEQSGQLSLIATSPRGGPASTLGASKRTARSFLVPHLEREAKIMADEVQGLRAFGSENEQAAVQPLVDQRLAELRSMHEVTLEYHRVGAIKGQILDSDGTTVVYNLFTEFGVTQQTAAIALSNSATKVRSAAVAIQRQIEAEVGAEPISGYRAFCGDAFFDTLVEHATVAEALKYQEGALLKGDIRKGFEFGGITWENYRGKVGSVSFFPTDEAYVVPEGTSLFATNFAPADFFETVNTVGLPNYAKMIFDDELNRWVKIHTQSNPLALCLRPRAVVKVTKT